MFQALLNSNCFDCTVSLKQNLLVNLSTHILTDSSRIAVYLGLSFSAYYKTFLPKLNDSIEKSFKNSKLSSSQLDALCHILTDDISSNNGRIPSNINSFKEYF